MDYISLFGYILVIPITLISIIVAFHFYHKYSLKFYRTFAYIIICGNLYILLAFVGNYLTEIILHDQPVEAAVRIKFAMIFSFMSMPFLFLFLFFIVVLFREIFGKPLTPNIKKVSLITGVIIVVIVTFGYIDFFRQNSSIITKTISMVLKILIPLIFLSGVSQGFFYLKEIKDLQHRRILLIFTLLFLGIFSFVSINLILISGLLYKISTLLPWGLILLIFMVKKMNEFYLLRPDSLKKSKSLEKTYKKFQITMREQEIISLICAGKSNRDIEDVLFISLQTVKNNIYNIFKKLKVKNRVELINFIRIEKSSDEISPRNN